MGGYQLDHLDDMDALRRAFSDSRLSLFLGAGVSVGSGLPTWDRLVLSIYFATISEQTMQGWRPYANYLHAIADWYLDRLSEPLEITARKVRTFYEDNDEGNRAFARAVAEGIYGLNTYADPYSLREGNATLRAVGDLSEASANGRHGVCSVITYNYDNLLEMVLEGRRPVSVVHSPTCRVEDGFLPIFHVHGYVPHEPGDMGAASSESIVFTEEEYNLAATDPYSWSNIVQLREMSSTVGLMIGLSLADRNIRRLLDALSRSPVRPRLYALLRTPRPVEVGDEDVGIIDEAARRMLDKFDHSGIKHNIVFEQVGSEREMPVSGVRAMGTKSRHVGVKSREMRVKFQSQLDFEVRGIIEQVELLERQQQEAVLRQLGITPIWFDEFDEIGGILAEIAMG